MAVEKLAGKTNLVATKVLASPQGIPPFYRFAEIHFPSIEALEACAGSAEAKETLAHADTHLDLVQSHMEDDEAQSAAPRPPSPALARCLRAAREVGQTRESPPPVRALVDAQG